MSQSLSEKLYNMITGYWITQAIYVVAKLEIADRLIEKPKTANELAEETNTYPDYLYRLLRALAGKEIFREDAHGKFHLTPMAELLQKSNPDSYYYCIMNNGHETFYGSWAGLLTSIETGTTAFNNIYGMNHFDYLSKHSDLSHNFNHYMRERTSQPTILLLKNYDFSTMKTIVDVGGGYGHFVMPILEKYPKLNAIVFDLDYVINDVKAKPHNERIQYVAGSFFDSIPKAADCYVLKHILHDWDDEKSQQILNTCAKSMAKGARLLIAETIIMPGNDPAFSKWLDLHMMILNNGKERTISEYEAMLNQAGLTLNQHIKFADTDYSIIEAIKE